MYMTYTYGMTSKPTPESVLQQIAQIRHMDRGSVSVIRQGPNGPYYNHQCYEGGRNVSRYVPSAQVAGLQEAQNNYRRFQQLIEQYVQLVVERTRVERQGVKKTTPPTFSSPRTRKSSN